MFSTLKKLLCLKKKEKSPLGFCDGLSSGKGKYSCLNCSEGDKYSRPYNPDNKLHIGVCKGKIKEVLRLQQKKEYNIYVKDRRQRTALHFACYYGHLDLVNFCVFNKCQINALDDEKSTPLMKAVQSSEARIVSVLLEQGADPSIKDINGETALHHAVYVDKPDIADSLLAFGGNIDEPTRDGLTPLLLAFQERKLLMAEHLITHGANIHVHDHYKRTTLMYAVRWDSKVIVELLLQQGIDHFFKDAFGWDALHYARAGKRKVKSIILEHENALIARQLSVGLENHPEAISLPGYPVAEARMNSQKLWQFIQDLHRFQPDWYTLKEENEHGLQSITEKLSPVKKALESKNEFSSI